MGNARRIVLTTRVFSKCGDAAAFFKEILHRYQIGDRVSAADAADLYALLERHDEFEKKSGTGVAGFEINIPPAEVRQYSNRCFWIVRKDGSKIDFSVPNCLKCQPYD